MSPMLLATAEASFPVIGTSAVLVTNVMDASQDVFGQWTRPILATVFIGTNYLKASEIKKIKV